LVEEKGLDFAVARAREKRRKKCPRVGSGRAWSDIFIQDGELDAFSRA
jgi:hypothetical protein